MTRVLLLQLPVPRLNYGVQTGNIPLGAACLMQAARIVPGVQVDVLPESVASYLGDAAILEILFDRKPDIVGFTVYCWNLTRSIYFAKELTGQTAAYQVMRSGKFMKILKITYGLQLYLD